MSFKENDINSTINSRNYEEFFILYIDNELSDEQMRMVDEFLAIHPDLQAEFDLLVSAKLPKEEISFLNKELFFSDNMKLNTVDEDLLLYIDNELTTDKIKPLEEKLASDKNFHLQHQLLLKTKLDATEKISYPDKEELYHRTVKVVAFKMWMRIAAAVILIAMMGILYWTNRPSSGVHPSIAVKNGTQGKDQPAQKAAASDKKSIDIPEQPLQQVAATRNNEKQKGNHNVLIRNEKIETKQLAQDNIADVTKENNDTASYKRNGIDSHLIINEPIASVDLPKETIKNVPVTNALPQRLTSIKPATTEPEAGKSSVADNDRKGSLKGFLRKATRLVERKTGIDPSNDNDELLIGAIAVKLK